MPNAVLVTGAAGFIGFHVAQRLLSEGREVVGLDIVNSYYDPKLKEARLDILKRQPNFTFAKLDLTDRTAIKTLFEKHRFPLVIHLAAQAGVRYSLERHAPHKKFHFIANENCNCSECPYMRRNTLEKLRDCLLNLEPRIELPEDLMRRAAIPIERMLAVR